MNNFLIPAICLVILVKINFITICDDIWMNCKSIQNWKYAKVEKNLKRKLNEFYNNRIFDSILNFLSYQIWKFAKVEMVRLMNALILMHRTNYYER